MCPGSRRRKGKTGGGPDATRDCRQPSGWKGQGATFPMADCHCQTMGGTGRGIQIAKGKCGPPPVHRGGPETRKGDAGVCERPGRRWAVYGGRGRGRGSGSGSGGIHTRVNAPLVIPGLFAKKKTEPRERERDGGRNPHAANPNPHHQNNNNLNSSIHPSHSSPRTPGPLAPNVFRPHRTDTSLGTNSFAIVTNS